MNLDDTIISLSTPYGVGAISVIRLSGEKSIYLADKFFTSIRGGKSLKKQKSHTIHFGQIVSKAVVLDEVLVSIFKKPHSYTGENIVEISCHGSIFIQQEIIKLFLENGCRLAEKGEFTMRAFLNGKMDLSQAEAVADLISSNSEASHHIAMQQLRGGINNELKELRAELLDFAALIELELDFSGEDVEFANKSKFKELVLKIISLLKRLIDSFSYGNAIKNGISVAIIGKPNVGKSTLLNTLLNEEKAIVSEIAGTTRDAIEDQIIIEGIAFRFIDTAGIRETKNIVESIGIKKTYEKANSSSVIIYLIDANDFSNSKEEFLLEIKGIEKRFPNKLLLIVANKIDLLSSSVLKILSNKNLILLSAKDQSSVKRLKQKLISLINTKALSNNETIITNSRHFESLNKALSAIISVQKSIELGVTSDLYSIDVKECLQHLGNITGAYEVDKDILGHIFSNFCVGK